VLVKNIRPDSFGRPGSRPENLTVVRGTLYFTADDGTHGRELWRSDGTRAGTVMVRNIFAGRGSSYPGVLTAAGRRVFFSARDGVHGRELWSSDGTRSGTALARDISPKSVGSRGPQGVKALGGRVYFSVDDGRHGEELWSSNGTRRGTFLLRDINATTQYGSPAGSEPSDLTVMGRRLFFSADDSIRGRELWRSDGTRAGTVLVKDVNPEGSGVPRQLTRIDDRLFFFADHDGQRGDELWTTDGTRRGKVLVKDIQPVDSPYGSYRGNAPTHLTAVRKKLFFAATRFLAEERSQRELWTSDGSAAGTVALRQLDIVTEGVHYFPWIPFTSVAGRLFFSASDGLHGEELWSSDGTVEGTQLVEDINPCAGNSVSGYYGSTVASSTGRLFFAANDVTHGTELWVSDGTAAGTRMVKDINRKPSP